MRRRRGEDRLRFFLAADFLVPADFELTDFELVGFLVVAVALCCAGFAGGVEVGLVEVASAGVGVVCA